MDSRPDRADAGEPPPAAARGSVVSEIWASVLGLESIDPDVPFHAMGGSSIDALFVLSRVRQDLGVNVSATDLLTYPTLVLFEEIIEERRRAESLDS